MVVALSFGGQSFAIINKRLFSGEVVNTKTPEGVSHICAVPQTPDYTRQLQFHEYELSQAEQRGFPEGQIAYHEGRVELLKQLGIKAVHEI